ncbi:MAG TPA: cupredoxin domain-containing protein [Candidatus Limnocylindrales bacterium]|jgi:hypothetical protein
MTPKLGSHRSQPGTAGRQVVEIVVEDGYHPDVVDAREGVPIRIVFARRDTQGCSDRVVFSQPRLERHLAPGATTIVDLPATHAREIRFTCGMGRYRGRINIIPATPRGGFRRWRVPRVQVLPVSLVVIAVALSLVVTGAAPAALGVVMVLSLLVTLLIAQLVLRPQREPR